MARKVSPVEPLEDRDGFRFRGGHAALDLAATLTGRARPTPIDLLGAPSDLGRWLKSAGLSRSAIQAGVRDLDLARELREAIYVHALAQLNGEAPPGARATLNRIAALPCAVPRLGADGAMRIEGSAEAFLSTVARQAIDLIGGPHAGRIKQCASDTCSILFVDTSRAGERRWCSMSACGNKAKVAEFRRRQE